MKEYALYKGEDLLAIGTVEEIAKETGTKRGTIMYYKSPSYRKRLIERNALHRNVRILVPLDDEVME